MKGKGARLRGRTASRATACPPEHTTGSATARSWIATSGSRSATEPSGADAHSSCREIDGQVVWCLSRVPRSMLQIYVCACVCACRMSICSSAAAPPPAPSARRPDPPGPRSCLPAPLRVVARAPRACRTPSAPRAARAAHERCGTWDRPCRRSNVMRTHF